MRIRVVLIPVVVIALAATTAQAANPKGVNASLTTLIGAPVTLVRGPALNGSPGYVDRRTRQIVLVPGLHAAVMRGPEAPRFALAMGLLAHELGHLAEPTAGFVPNNMGGLDFDERANEDAADAWAYENMDRVYRALGYPVSLAGRSVRTFKQYRATFPY